MDGNACRPYPHCQPSGREGKLSPLIQLYILGKLREILLQKCFNESRSPLLRAKWHEWMWLDMSLHEVTLQALEEELSAAAGSQHSMHSTSFTSADGMSSRSQSSMARQASSNPPHGLGKLTSTKTCCYSQHLSPFISPPYKQALLIQASHSLCKARCDVTCAHRECHWCV